MVNDKLVRSTIDFFRNQGAAIAAAVAFYTCLPVPMSWTLEFRGIARLAPAIGLLIGGMLGLADVGLQLLGMPALTRSALVIVLGIAVTGGLHLDGAMDAADGLAVPDPVRRLEVMRDSVTGAFGAMAAIAIVFGVFTGSLLATLLTFMIFLMGSFSANLVTLGAQSKDAAITAVTRNLYLVLPDLSRLDLKNQAVYGLLPPMNTLLLNAGYGLLYIVLMLAIASLLFSRREF